MFGDAGGHTIQNIALMDFGQGLHGICLLYTSGKETKELKSSLDTIRKTAAEMIEGIDAKLKVLLAEKAQIGRAHV